MSPKLSQFVSYTKYYQMSYKYFLCFFVSPEEEEEYLKKNKNKKEKYQALEAKL